MTCRASPSRGIEAIVYQSDGAGTILVGTRDKGRVPVKRQRVVGLTAAIFASVAIAAGAFALLHTLGTPEAVVAAVSPAPTPAKDLAGNDAVLDPGVTSPPGSNAVEDTGERFRVPSVELDVPLGEVSEVDGEITPPGFGSVYIVRNRGVGLASADQGTVYAVTHSVRGGGVAPGNALIDVRNKKAAVDVGSVIDIGDRQYEVTGTLRVGKGELPTTSQLWEDVPGRLVVITCLQNPQGKPSSDNMVVTAQLIE